MEERTEAFDALSEVLERYPPGLVSEIAEVDEETIIRVAELYARSEKSSIVNQR